jgi:choline kinase
MLDTVIILAAGRGTRLQPLTNDLPKGMVPLHGRSLLEWQVEAARAAGAQRIVVVTGYEADKVELPGVIRVHNERFAETNMVASLMTARGYFGDGFVLAYSDIVYEPHVLRSVMESTAQVSCAIDHDWQSYWEARFGDPLEDAETLRLSGDRIVEIGQVPQSIEEIEGQFVGLVGFRGEGIVALETIVGSAYALAATGERLDGCPRLADQLYTTDLLQALIAREKGPVQVPIDGAWLEIDDLSDHALAERLSVPGQALLGIERGASQARLAA